MKRELAGGRVRYLGAWHDDVPVTARPEVAVAGRSNVGKSRCLNALVGVRSAARVSGTPGRTQAVHLFEVEGRYVIADLPGYGFARVPPEVQVGWKRLVEGYLGGPRDLRLVLVLVDPRREPGGMDEVLIRGLRQAGTPFLVVATKADRLSRRELERSLHALSQHYHLNPLEILAFSALDRQGLEALNQRIHRAVAAQ